MILATPIWLLGSVSGYFTVAIGLQGTIAAGTWAFRAKKARSRSLIAASIMSLSVALLSVAVLGKANRYIAANAAVAMMTAAVLGGLVAMYLLVGSGSRRPTGRA